MPYIHRHAIDCVNRAFFAILSKQKLFQTIIHKAFCIVIAVLHEITHSPFGKRHCRPQINGRSNEEQVQITTFDLAFGSFFHHVCADDKHLVIAVAPKQVDGHIVVYAAVNILALANLFGRENREGRRGYHIVHKLAFLDVGHHFFKGLKRRYVKCYKPEILAARPYVVFFDEIFKKLLRLLVGRFQHLDRLQSLFSNNLDDGRREI